MNKMVINHLDKLFVTSDAHTIIDEMEVQHPAAKLVVFASRAQQQEIGDGTNFVRGSPAKHYSQLTTERTPAKTDVTCEQQHAHVCTGSCALFSRPEAAGGMTDRSISWAQWENIVQVPQPTYAAEQPHDKLVPPVENRARRRPAGRGGC